VEDFYIIIIVNIVHKIVQPVLNLDSYVNPVIMATYYRMVDVFKIFKDKDA